MPDRSRSPRLRLVGGGVPGAARERRFGSLADLEDQQLVALARENDVSAFEILYRRHAAFAMNLAVRIQGSSLDVEDVVHDSFLKAHRRLSDLRRDTSFRAWLGSIVVRLVRSRLRRNRLLERIGIGGAAEPVDLDAIASTGASPELRAQLAQIYALLRTMPADERIAWTLRFVERQKLEVVAEMTACSLATAKRRIRRAQDFLQQHFVSPLGETKGSASAADEVEP